MANMQQQEPHGDAMDALWERYVAEGNFSPDIIEIEKQDLRDEIGLLEATIVQKRDMLARIDGRVDTAKDQMKAMVSAGLSADAVLLGLRVQYKTGRTQSPKAFGSTTKKKIEISEADQTLVLNNLDREGLSLVDLRERTEKDTGFLHNVLKALVADGKVENVGEGRATLYRLLA